MEEENKNEDLESLMSKIEEAMKMSTQKQDDIDKKLKKLAQKKRVMEYEELKQEIETDESSKAEFDEMTVGALVRAKKEVLKQKDTLQKGLKETMTKANEDYKKAYEGYNKVNEDYNKAYAEVQLIKQHAERTLKSYEEKGNPETIERAKKSAEKAIGNAEKNLDDAEKNLDDAKKNLDDATKKFLGIQTEYKDKMSKLDEYEIQITKIADKLGALNEINAVKLEEEKKEQVTEGKETTEVKPEQSETKTETVDEEKVEEPEEVVIEPEPIPTDAESTKDNPEQTPEEIAQDAELPEEEKDNAEGITYETIIGKITITNKQAIAVGKDDYKQRNPLYNEVELEDFLEEFRDSKLGELYTEDSLKQIYNDSRVDRNILVGLLANKMQLTTYLSALGYENLPELSSDFEIVMPEIEYDLKDRAGTKITERYEIYKSALETKRLFEEKGIEDGIEIKAGFVDKGIFAVMGTFEKLKQKLQKTKALPERTTLAEEKQSDEEVVQETEVEPEKEKSFRENIVDHEGDEKREEVSKKVNEREPLVEEKKLEQEVSAEEKE